jgi:hypothetical protein
MTDTPTPAPVDLTPEDRRLRNAIANVLVNGSNYPPKVTPRILGQDMTPLIDKVFEAVNAAKEVCS